MLVDKYLNKKIVPSDEVISCWLIDMVKYFKDHRDIDKMKEVKDAKIGMEEIEKMYWEVLSIQNSICWFLLFPWIVIASWNIRSLNQEKKQKDARNLIQEEKLQVCAILETHLKAGNLSTDCDKVFGSWSWISNSSFSKNSSRIVVAWNSNRIKLSPITVSRHSIFCIVEALQVILKCFVVSYMLQTQVWKEEVCGKSYKWLKV
ncbi:RNA-directed DNA polymerase, eukaryota, Reverse transcriptase zinc-binding domain protein [Artemisia annua]|uniref:RNA-directed DNA polymerase, eukaryota, Reverse transcriptase zinc-binding domain protein n=1 Tax=Artemisia annua TaxID=35608 RepID=A0A2U1LT92_ARTAN|nr:RNA-directed DNA polymerase, eukaryota, Reverse transcriptase zinc-binding domain protein [Artemisia annua]